MWQIVLSLFVSGVAGQLTGNPSAQVCQLLIGSLNCQSFDYKPVCGTDGNVYKTECDFAKAHCADAMIKVANEGVCPGSATTAPPVVTSAPAGTTQIPDQTTPMPDTTQRPPDLTTPEPAGTTAGTPVVTTQPPVGTTQAPVDTTQAPVDTQAPSDTTQTPVWTSQAPVVTSQAPAATTAAATTPDPSLTPLCQQIVGTPCEADVNQLCGTDGVSYQNYCEFSKGRCYYPTIEIAYSGACSPTDTFAPVTRPTRAPTVFDILCRALEGVVCQDEGIPVCGSDGNTYPSACDLEKAKCKNNAIKVVNC